MTLDYDRRQERLTQSIGYLGEFLNSFKKPTSIISENWFSIKGNIYNIVYRITEEILVHKRPLKIDNLNLPDNFRVNIDEIENINGNIVFSIEIKTDDKIENIWIKSTYSNSVKRPSKGLEKIENSIQFLLSEINEEIQGEELQATGGSKSLDSNAFEVSKGVFAIFSNKKENVEKAPLLIPE